MDSTWVFMYWEAGDKVTRASSIPTEKVFGSLGKLGEWRPTNELNKAYVEKKTKIEATTPVYINALQSAD
jgi:hypothetical protein